jgi:UDP-N-acetylglucosamine--N-acetylmuramyl-(pentapeptide) pyrophosphoryl-undecaprenol N-acetylglucosamine transferase
MKKLRLIIAGGGTGGHIFPAVAIAHAVLRLSPDSEVLFVGALGRMEMEKVPREGFRIIGLDIAGFQRGNLLANWSLPFKLIKSRIQARRIIREFKPDVVVGVGGYASFPMLSAAQGMGIPTLVQEQNSYAGKSNKILARQARAICVAYEGMDRFFPASVLQLTGNPVRKLISGMTATPDAARRHFGLEPDRFTIFITGGSLGAKTINETISAGLPALTAMGFQIIWQTGTPYYSTAKASAAAVADRVKVMEFIQEMDQAYAAADLVISRAGALAIAEICIAAKPVIFIPYPFAAENHQESNAHALVAKNAARMVLDKDAPGQLVQEITNLSANAGLRQEMSAGLSALAIRNADSRIAEKIFEIAA